MSDEDNILHEQLIRIPLDGGEFIEIRITIASVPKVGPGPRPGFMEVQFARRIDAARALIVNADVKQGEAGAIVVGPGGHPH